MKEKLEFEDIDTPLLQTRDVKNVALVIISGERGLCGPYNSRIIKLTEARIEELRSQGIEPKLIFIGKKLMTISKSPRELLILCLPQILMVHQHRRTPKQFNLKSSISSTLEKLIKSSSYILISLTCQSTILRLEHSYH